MWHASIGFFGSPVVAWTRGMRKTAEKAANAVLRGVGNRDLDPIVQAGDVALHVRMFLKPAELQLLPQHKLPTSFEDHPAPRW